MQETSNPPDERLIDVTAGTIKQLLLLGYKHYNEAMKEDHKGMALYWDGYIRALQHVMEAESQ